MTRPARTSETPSPDELAARWRANGETGALGALFDTTAPELLRIALALAPDAASAEDVLQETYLAAIEFLPRFDPSQRVMPWLVGILRHKAAMARRVAARPIDGTRAPRPAESADPAVAAQLAEERAAVRHALDRLPEPYREVAVLRWRYGLEPAEIADARGTPPGTVRSLLHRAAERMRRELRVLPAILFGGPRARGLDAVRESVLKTVRRRAAGTTAAGAVPAGLVLGGVVMAKELVAAVAVVLAFAGGWWLLSDGTTSTPPRAVAIVPSSQAAAPAKRVAAADTPPATAVEDEEAGRSPPIRGSVHAIDGGPIEGALVELVRLPVAQGRTVLATTRTDARGSFSLRSDRHGADVQVAASARDHVRKYRPAAPGSFADFALPVGGMLRGRVIDEETGEGLAGARVAVVSVGHPSEGGGDRTVTAADGTYEFPHALPWKLSIHAVAPGYAWRWAHVEVAAGATTVHDIPVSRGATIRGRVTRDGLPVARARVTLRNWLDESAPVPTDDDGRYVLSGLAGDPAEAAQALGVSCDGPLHRDVLLPASRGRELNVDVDLSDCWTIRGVVRSGGAPVPRARVALVAWLGAVESPLRFETARADGTFELAANERDPCEVWVEGPDPAQFAQVKVPRPKEGSVAEGVVVDLPAVGWVRARVVGAEDGAPIAGATAAAQGRGFGVADESGVLRLSLPPTSNVASFHAVGFRAIDAREVRVTAGETTDLGDVALTRGSSVAGRVRTPDGSPLASACVFANWLPRGGATSLTGADGRFRLDGVAQGLVTVTATFPGRTDAKAENVAAGSVDVDLVLAAPVPSLAGVVSTADGRPARNFRITGFLRHAAPDGADEASPSISSFVQAGDGRFALSGAPWTEKELSEVEVTCGDQAARTPVAPVAGGTADLRVALAPGARIRGRVSVAGGAPAVGARIAVLRDRERTPGVTSLLANRVATTDADGRFEVGPLVGGGYRLVLEAQGWPRRVVDVEARTGEATDVDQTLAAGDVRIRVLDPDGAPVEHADAYLLDADGRPVLYRASMTHSDHEIGTTAPDGTLVAARLDPGRYRIRAVDRRTGGAKPSEADVEVRAGETAELVVRLLR